MIKMMTHAQHQLVQILEWSPLSARTSEGLKCATHVLLHRLIKASISQIAFDLG
jgi:hypothetical protein